MYKEILVPVALDNPHGAAAAIKIASMLQGDGGSITLLHVVEQIPAYATADIPEGLLDRAHSNASSSLEKIVEGISASVETKIVGGHAARTILDEADKNGVDCIVMASHRPGLQDYFIGSTAAHVVRHSTCAVHVIR